MTDNQNHVNGAIRTPADVLADARAERDALIEANRAGFAEIARMGAQVDPGTLLNARIDILAQMVFGGEDTPGFIEFQLRFERVIAAQLDNIRVEVRKARLAAGVGQFSPQQVQQMAQPGGGLIGPDGQPLR